MVACRSTEVVSASMSRRGLARPADQQRDPPELAVDRSVRLPEEIVLPEVVAMVGAEDDAGGLGQPGLVDGVEQATEPVVDHGQLGPVVGPDVARPVRDRDGRWPMASTRYGRPDGQAPLPVVVVHLGVGQRSVERLVGVELVDHQEEAVMGWGRRPDPVGGGGHGPGPGEVLLGPEVGAGVVVGVVVRRPLDRQGRGADPGRVGGGPPRVALVASLVGPCGEVGVVVLPPVSNRWGWSETSMVVTPRSRSGRVMASSQISMDPQGRQGKSRAPTRMSWRAGMQGSEPA